MVALKHGKLPWTRFIVFPSFSAGVTFLLTAAVMFWGSKVGKVRLRERVLNAIPWRGDERVLDVGCGHGLMLIGAAHRLLSGKATGIDLWQKEDQAGNSREATWQNIKLENIEDKVEMLDGDARKLPFPNDAFDVVLSSWALHNIYDPPGRDLALQEIVRVLKPGGRVAIIDIRHSKEYAGVFQKLSMENVRRAGPNFLFFIPSYTVTAMKAA